jgi:hypothetical protein
MKKLLILNLISVIIFCSLACGQTTSNEIIKITSINSIKIDLLKNIIANKSGVNLDDKNALANLRTHELLKLINSSNIRTLVDLKDVAKLNTDENKLRQHTTIINSKSIPIQFYIEEFIYDKLYQEISESAPRTGWFLDRINRRYVLKELEKLNSKDVGAYLSSYSDYTDIVKEIDRLISENKIDLSDRATLEIVVDYLIDSISCEELHATTNQVANNLLANNKLAHLNFGLRIINRIIYYKLPKKIINNLFTLYFDNYLNSNNADCESSTNFIASSAKSVGETLHLEKIKHL